ncbi:MAG: glucose-1-phosphate adenylyltransferase [Acidobacteria bacterium]|nr:glucose-1-phosphate adenylyltransferase [Acidobacteriota bacterium]
MPKLESAIQSTYTVILGGGRGSRLHPLTRDRAKPAVPLGGKYRLIDIPLSNAINSGFRQIAVLTQFNSASLNSHISDTYRFDIFRRGSVEVFAAQQTDRGNEFFQGTADAVRKVLKSVEPSMSADHVLILSGDHLYRMDYSELLETHVTSGADVTVSVIPVHRSQCAGFGILLADDAGRIRSFKEKPKTDAEVDALTPPEALRKSLLLGPDERLASMGVYIFRMDVAREVLAREEMLDFGKDIIPSLIATHKVQAHLFRGYWQDIGTIDSFFDANLGLTDENPAFRFYHPNAPIYTRARFLPASKFHDTVVRHSIVSDGCLLFGSEIDHCVIGVRARVQRDTRLKDVIVMGNDFYEEDEVRAVNLAKGLDAAGIGPGCTIERAIIDKNARIGAGCTLRGRAGRPDSDGDGWFLRDGILLIPKNGRIPAGTVIE